MIYIIDIEPHESRYTCEWNTQMWQTVFNDSTVISGNTVEHNVSEGGFLNFGATNIYKSEQIQKVAELFTQNKIKNGDKFLFTDAWHTGALQVKYMAELQGVDVKLYGMWHAGSYDPQDFLGRIVGDAEWVRQTEKALYNAYDTNLFATDFHKQLLETTLNVSNSSKVVGWPMDYLKQKLSNTVEKKNQIVFPHRIAPEKQPEIFRDLARQMPEATFVFAQELNLSKEEYHNLLAESKLMFSANLQETLGISWYEAALAGCMPVVPARLSYKEMATSDALYPSSWTESWEAYNKNKGLVVGMLRYRMEQDYSQATVDLAQRLEQYFSSNALAEELA